MLIIELENATSPKVSKMNVVLAAQHHHNNRAKKVIADVFIDFARLLEIIDGGVFLTVICHAMCAADETHDVSGLNSYDLHL